ncbi:MAG: glycosyltransferase family 2 protein [Pyrinomonas methylaliphatogenes]|nr:glycosyltransferase family 2 protein [Pyrinomonas methylaliphatogenes]
MINERELLIDKNDAAARDLSVVIPVFRNASTLLSLYEHLHGVLNGIGRTWEIIFVDDACPEGSKEILQSLAEMDQRITAIELSRNVGQGRAIWIGLHAARGRYIVVMDADLQDPPEAIPRLLEALERERVSVVFAGRRGRYESLSRLATSKIFKSLLSLLCGTPPDAGSFLIMRREVVAAILDLDTPTIHLPTLIGCLGFSSRSIPIIRRPREVGASAYTFGARKQLALRALALAWQLKRDAERFRRTPETDEWLREARLIRREKAPSNAPPADPGAIAGGLR